MSASADKPSLTCRKCGAPLQRGGHLAGQCAACLLELAWDEEEVPTANVERFHHYQVATRADGTPLELGRGAMGVTYKASDTVLGHSVALKVIDACIAAHPEARERFLREARAAARLRHPNVASVFYYGVRKSDGQCFYAMELVEGETLEARLRRFGPLPTTLALEVIAQVAKALVAAEAHSLVHRDLKPANLMLVEGPELTVKVIDFGLAKAAATAGSEADLTHGGFVGTPAFASPERFTGANVDVRSDLYSLGITLWEMLTGQTPFRGDHAQVMYQHQHAPLPLEQLKGVPQPVVVLVEVLLEKDPATRLQSPAQLLKAMPAVTDAVKARRRITLLSLRSSDGRALSRQQILIKNLGRLRLEMTGSRLRLIVWFAIVPLMFGGLILVVFLGSHHQDSATSASQLSVAKAPEKSIAVLPFESLSDNKNDTYFADGVQDEILSNLAKVSQLKVISRTSVMTYRPGGNRNLRSIANALGVANVVEGTVRRDGHWIRVTTALIDAQTDQTLWSDSYDRDLTGIFAIQSEIAKAVASKLSARLSPEERQNIQGSPTEDLEAYDLFLQAKELMSKLTFIYMMDPRESVLRAIALLEEATRKDSQFALAYCLLANANDYLYSGNFDKTTERRTLGDAAVNQALRVRPDLPEAHLAAAFHRYACYRDYDRARLQIAIAQRSLPNSPDALTLAADLDRRQGRWLESTTSLEKAAALDPRNPEVLSALAANYFALRRYLDYERTYDRLIELEPDKPLLILQKAYSEINGNGDLKSYRAALDRLPSSMEGDVVVDSFRFAYALAARNWTTAREILSKSTNGELYYFNANMMVPKGCLEIWIAYLEGGHPAMEPASSAAREQLNQKVQTYPEEATIISALGVIDAALGRNEEALKETERAVKMVPVSEDAVDGPSLVYNLAVVYGMVNERDLAFQALNMSANTPGGVAYGELKLDPALDPLRSDPRFDKLLVQLAPHN